MTSNKKNKEHMTLVINDENVKESLDTIFKFGTVFLTYKTINLATKSDKEFDAKKIFSDKHQNTIILFIFIGFLIYYNLVKKLPQLNVENKTLKNVYDDTLKFGTVLLVQHLSSSCMEKTELFNENWLKNIVYVIAAFATYRVSLDKILDNKISNRSEFNKDIAQYSSFLVLYRIMQGKEITKEWLLSMGLVISGFTVYHKVVKNVINVENK